ncbi:MAG TPA: glycosyltransferase family 39 protein [Thermomicrobiales bacterium]|nr:glycosyltransferase family 39 protein [Thermomicrobiales bacterium]
MTIHDIAARADTAVASRPALSRRVWRLAVAGVVALAAVIRLVLLVRANWMIEADEATLGLVARDIQTEHVRPIFYPGQAYMGTLQAYVAAVLFEIFGMSRQVIKLVPLAGSLAFVATLMLLARRVYDDRAGIVAGLAAAVPSLYVISNTVRMYGPMIEVMAIGNVILLIAIDTVYRDDPPARYWPRCVALGLLTGFGFWLHTAVLFYALPATVVLLARWPRRALTVALPIGIPTFVLGALPVFWFARDHDYTTFHYLLGTGSERTDRDLLAVGNHLVRHILPRFLGVSFPGQDQPLVLQLLVAVPTVAALVWIAARSWRAPLDWLRLRVPQTHPDVVLVLFGAVTLLGYLLSRFSIYAVQFSTVDATGRYPARLAHPDRYRWRRLAPRATRPHRRTRRRGGRRRRSPRLPRQLPHHRPAPDLPVPLLPQAPDVERRPHHRPRRHGRRRRLDRPLGRQAAHVRQRRPHRRRRLRRPPRLACDTPLDARSAGGYRIVHPLTPVDPATVVDDLIATR